MSEARILVYCPTPSLFGWTPSATPAVPKWGLIRPDQRAGTTDYTKRMLRSGRLAIVLLAGALTAACSPPITVDTIQVGRSLNTDQSIANLTTTFKPNETVYVSALNGARGHGTITVKWFYGSQMLSERTKQVTFKGSGATSFNISTATEFPEGDYSVEVIVDGKSIGKRSFDVRR